MAISKDVTFKGLAVPDAYIVVVLPTITLSKTEIEFGVRYKASPADQPFNSSSRQCPYDLEGDNPFEQAYEYLKTLPEFEGCTDC